MHRPKLSPASKVALSYCLAAVLWIVGSDWLAERIVGADAEHLAFAQTIKGLAFVILMTVALYLVLQRLHRVQERNQQVEAMLRVSERLETVGSLAATLVHDLNNMLAVIRGFTELAKLEHGEEGNVDAARLNDIENAVLRANHMVRQLSLFLRQTSGEAAPVHPGEVLRELEPLLRQAATRRVDVNLEIHPPVPRVCVERGLLEQALLNLTVNARDAMEGRAQRELRIVVSSVRLRRHRSAQQPRPVSGDFVRIRASDTGCGIPPDCQMKIFEPFYTTKPAGQGTGLGLPSVLRTAQQHGGWVEVRSEPGQGACFDLYLPPASEPPAFVA